MKIFLTVLFFAMFVGWLILTAFFLETLIKKLKNTWYVRLFVPIPAILLFSLIGGLIFGFLMKYLDPFWSEAIFFIAIFAALVLWLFVGNRKTTARKNTL